jgi:hypothetical protein
MGNDSIAGEPWGGIYQSPTLPAQSVEQGRFTHVGTAHDCNDGRGSFCGILYLPLLRHGISVLILGNAG